MYGLTQGIAAGVLTTAEFGGAVRLGWQALAAQVQPDGSVTNLSPGVGILPSRHLYLKHWGRNVFSPQWGYGAVLRACAAVGAWMTHGMPLGSLSPLTSGSTDTLPDSHPVAGARGE